MNIVVNLALAYNCTILARLQGSSQSDDTLNVRRFDEQKESKAQSQNLISSMYQFRIRGHCIF